MAKSDRQLRQLRADQDGSARRRLRRRHRARRLRQRQRRQRPEHLHRARRRRSTRRRSARRSSAASPATRSSRWRATSATPSPRSILPREALYIADEVFFVGTAAEVTPVRSVDKIRDRRRPPRPGHRGAAAARSSTSSTARCPTRTAGSPTSTRTKRRCATPRSAARADRQGQAPGQASELGWPSTARLDPN